MRHQLRHPGYAGRQCQCHQHDAAVKDDAGEGRQRKGTQGVKGPAEDSEKTQENQGGRGQTQELNREALGRDIGALRD